MNNSQYQSRQKVCKGCNEEQNLDAFYKKKNGKYGVEAQCKTCISQRKVKYYNQNATYINKRGRQHYSENKERIAVYSHMRYQENIIKQQEYSRLYSLKRRHHDVNFKLQKNSRKRLHSAIKNYQKVGSAVRDLGCSIPELKKHLEDQFQPGMTWDNWSKTGWHVDHIKPLSSFDLSVREELKIACHYSNLQPLWAKDNLRKGSKS